MFGFGITEIITIIIVIIVLINPRDLPVIIRKIGKIYGSIMRQINALRKDFHTFEEEVRTAADLSDSDLGEINSIRPESSFFKQRTSHSMGKRLFKTIRK